MLELKAQKRQVFRNTDDFNAAYNRWLDKAPANERAATRAMRVYLGLLPSMRAARIEQRARLSESGRVS